MGWREGSSDPGVVQHLVDADAIHRLSQHLTHTHIYTYTHTHIHTYMSALSAVHVCVFVLPC